MSKNTYKTDQKNCNADKSEKLSDIESDRLVLGSIDCNNDNFERNFHWFRGSRNDKGLQPNDNEFLNNVDNFVVAKQYKEKPETFKNS